MVSRPNHSLFDAVPLSLELLHLANKSQGLVNFALRAQFFCLDELLVHRLSVRLELLGLFRRAAVPGARLTAGQPALLGPVEYFARTDHLEPASGQAVLV